MEIKYAYEMTRKAEEVRKEIQAKNNALARAFIEDHIMPEIERVAGTGETLYECSLASINDKRVKISCRIMVIKPATLTTLFRFIGDK